MRRDGFINVILDLSTLLCKMTNANKLELEKKEHEKEKKISAEAENKLRPAD